MTRPRVHPAWPLAALVLLLALANCVREDGSDPTGPDLAPAELAFTSQPSNGAVDAPLAPVEVALRDGEGNTVTSATDEVSLSLAGGDDEATLSGATTVNAADGVATFSDLAIDRVGDDYTLTAASGDLQATSEPFRVASLLFETVAAGGFHACGIGTGGMLCWGEDGAGQLGDGTPGDNSPSPAPVSGSLDFATADGGAFHTCGVTADDAAYCWGQNGNGQLGDGTDEPRATPAAVAGDLSFALVSAGGSHTCGVTTEESDNTRCWGDGFQGKLGDGTGISRDTPVRVDGEHGFALVSAGRGHHTCALEPDGAAWCWGDNTYGQLGDGGGLFGEGLSQEPFPVDTDLAFEVVAAGDAFTCAVSTDEGAYCWGWNASGQLGDGTGEDRDVPTAVSGGLSFRSVSAGDAHACGVATDGAAWCWGANASGQLGDGTTDGSDVPVAVSGGLEFERVSAGDAHTCGRSAGGDVWCWGEGASGQLGDGEETSSLVPVLVTDA